MKTCIHSINYSQTFQCKCHPQGAYTNTVKTYSNTIVLQ